MKTIVIIEDQTTLRDLICQWIEANTDFKVIAQTGDGEEGCQLCLDLKPDMVILDILLPSLNGSEILKRFKSKNLKAHTMVFTALTDNSTVNRLLKLGVTGIITKSAPLDELSKGILAVAEGQAFYSTDIVDTMCQLMRTGEVDSTATLTSRERQVTQLIANSFTNKQIAEKLNTSVRTVDTHRNNIMRKLNLHDAAALTRWAVANRLIDPFKETLPEAESTS